MKITIRNNEEKGKRYEKGCAGGATVNLLVSPDTFEFVMELTRNLCKFFSFSDIGSVEF